MTNVTSQTVTMNVGGPFKFCSVGVAGADVAGLKLLELLLGAEFIGLEKGNRLAGNAALTGKGDAYHDQ